MSLDPKTLIDRLSGPAFDALSSKSLETMLEDAAVSTLSIGETAVEAGEALHTPLVLLEGRLDQARGLNTDSPVTAPSFLGIPSLMEDAAWADTWFATAPSTILRLQPKATRRAIATTPEAFVDHPIFAAMTAQQKRLMEAITTGSAFTTVDDAVYNELMLSLPLRFLPAGTQVMAKGEESPFSLIVVAGLLRVSITTENGRRQLFGNFLCGSSIGEIGLILDQPRSADVIAARDTIVAVLDRNLWNRAVELAPVKMAQTATRLVYQHLSPQKSKADGQIAKTFSIIPLSAETDGHWIAEALSDALSMYGTVRHLRSSDADSSLDDAVSETLSPTRRLQQADQDADFVILEGDPADTAWNRRCLREVENILLVADGDINSRPHWIAAQLEQASGGAMIEQGVIAIHPDDGAVTARSLVLPEWIHRDHFFNIRRGRKSDVARMARILIGQAVGLVLGGGGARGFAHLGVIRAFEEAGTPVDMIGGNSMGALLGAQIAMGKPLSQILEDTRAFAQKGERPTLPIVSLVGGYKLRAGIQALVGDLPMEKLWRSFFAVSCNLSTSTVTVLDKGPLWRAVLASNSPAGIAPPTLSDGHLLVDGAILNNLPIDVMRDRLRNGYVLGIDVNPREELTVAADTRDLAPMRVIKSRWGGSRTSSLPNISDILHRAGTIGGLAHRERVQHLADHLLLPPVHNFSLIGYGRANEIEEVGYRAGLENMERITTILSRGRKTST